MSKKTQSKRTIKVDDNKKTDDNSKTDDKRTIRTDDKRTLVIDYIRRNGEAKTEDLVKLLGSSTYVAQPIMLAFNPDIRCA